MIKLLGLLFWIVQSGLAYGATIELDQTVICKALSFVKDGTPIGSDRLTDEFKLVFPATDSFKWENGTEFRFGVGEIREVKPDIRFLDREGRPEHSDVSVYIHVRKTTADVKTISASIKFMNPFTRQWETNKFDFDAPAERSLNYLVAEAARPASSPRPPVLGELLYRKLFCLFKAER